MTSETYDPKARRDTPLALKLKALIRERGPISVKEYMQACLLDAEYGYYRRQIAIGRDGDFVTAPEISQVFGELIGLWCAVVWQQMGSPSTFNIVELGPGRGTMLRDALRAARRVPGCIDAARVVLIEPSQTLRELQRATLQGHAASITHLEPGEIAPDAPSIVLANEVLDCIAIHQLVRAPDVSGEAVWQLRMVGLDDDGRLDVVLGKPKPLRPVAGPALPPSNPGDILEDRNCRGLISSIADHAKDNPVAALLIDYGHTRHGYGDTLQAVREHRFEHPLTSPGEADLTAQVDFEAFGLMVREHSADPRRTPLTIDGPVTQADFLGALGVIERASKLMAANAAKAHMIEAGVARLLAPNGMGTRFKAIGVRSENMPPLPGFPPNA